MILHIQNPLIIFTLMKLLFQTRLLKLGPYGPFNPCIELTGKLRPNQIDVYPTTIHWGNQDIITASDSWLDCQVRWLNSKMSISVAVANKNLETCNAKRTFAAVGWGGEHLLADNEIYGDIWHKVSMF